MHPASRPQHQWFTLSGTRSRGAPWLGRRNLTASASWGAFLGNGGCGHGGGTRSHSRSRPKAQWVRAGAEGRMEGGQVCTVWMASGIPQWSLLHAVPGMAGPCRSLEGDHPSRFRRDVHVDGAPGFARFCRRGFGPERTALLPLVGGAAGPLCVVCLEADNRTQQGHHVGRHGGGPRGGS